MRPSRFRRVTTRAAVSALCAAFLAGCSQTTVTNPEAIDALVERARDTGRVLPTDVKPNDTYDGWYVFATPDRPYPNAAGFMLQRDGDDGPVCVRQDEVGSGQIAIIPSECGPAAGDVDDTDAEFALSALLLRAQVLAMSSDDARIAEELPAAASQLREEGHAFDVTVNEPGRTEVRVGEEFACSVVGDGEITTYVGKCPKG